MRSPFSSSIIRVFSFPHASFQTTPVHSNNSSEKSQICFGVRLLLLLFICSNNASFPSRKSNPARRAGFGRNRIETSWVSSYSTVLIYFSTVIFFALRGSIGFSAFSGTAHVLPIKYAPSILPSFKYCNTRLTVIFHFIEVSFALKYFINLYSYSVVTNIIYQITNILGKNR